MKAKQSIGAGAGYLLVFALLAGSSLRGNADVAFEFETNGVLPSLQGATYVGTLAEISVFSVTNGVLHQDTTPFSDQSAYYTVAGVFDHSKPTTLEWGCRVLSASGQTYGQHMALRGGGALWSFVIEPAGLRIFDGVSYKRLVAMDTTDALHTYRVEIPAGQAKFDLYIDGFLRAPAQQVPIEGDTTPLLIWGDATGADGNGAVDWGFVRLSGPPVCTPPMPPVLSIFLSAAEICWCSHTNTVYQVQWAASPDSTNWTNFGAALQGTGAEMCVFDSTRERAKRFYRVEALP